MRLASFTDYSLRVLIYLAIKEEELSTVAEIADKYQISRNHLVKVVHNLSVMEIIKSYKGKGGGIALLVPADKINIGDLVRKLERDSKLVECFGSDGSCIINPTCKLKKALMQAEQSFYKTLQEYTLADIVSNQTKLAQILLP
ncbi:Rrf2 family transcriptional regulator [Bacteriovorax sp. Seq25_V]|uniref:Rrf2 family transcriptional regulator n=1 Tax=Bacteriovorax sp. Seq25_V TaxID=1201288 RepID=UPI00038A3B84|nr:Rrf2 family transcriptional regulator [Bacteriovorax sp. Seq25_V]EQC47115.1 transcriptional regulator [Bacteriovorax sp. Seq25_V]